MSSRSVNFTIFLHFLGAFLLSTAIYNLANKLASPMDLSNTCLTMDTTVGNEIYFITSNRGGGHLEFRCTQRKRYLASKLNYCTKLVSHFQLVRLAMSGNINPNPGPSVVNKKCQTCGKTILRHHLAVPYEICEASYHSKCAKVSPAEYKNIYLPAGNCKWQCTTCEYQWQVLRELPLQISIFLTLNVLEINNTIICQMKKTSFLKTFVQRTEGNRATTFWYVT